MGFIHATLHCHLSTSRMHAYQLLLIGSPCCVLYSAVLVTGQPEEQPCVQRTGAAVLALSGAVTLQLLVAQGCRPLSPDTYTITKVAPGPTGGVLVLELSPAADGGGPSMTPVEALQRDVKRAFAEQGKAQTESKADL